ncbi:MAG: alpha-amylase family glycosyl hydrolase [Acidimicrobiales bacterium]
MTADDPRWYQRAIFYEVLVRSFRAPNGDGTGDLLRHHREARLPRVAWVDCLWPRRSTPAAARRGLRHLDFFTVHPDYGTVGDAAEPHRTRPTGGIRVIADMVMNHTSDLHPLVPGEPPEPHQPEARLVRNDDNERWSEFGSSSSTPV